MENKIVVKWSWVTAQETFNKEQLSSLSPLATVLQCWCNFVSMPVRMTTLKRGGNGGSYIVRNSCTTNLLSFYRKTNYPWTTSAKNSALQDLSSYITTTCLVRARYVLELRFHFPSRACQPTHCVCFKMCCRVMLAVCVHDKKVERTCGG